MWAKKKVNFIISINIIDYDKQYEFRIAAKSANSKDPINDVYGQEAVYRISTHTSKYKKI